MDNQNEQKYKMSTGGIFQCRYDAGWTVIHANDSLFHFLGYTREEFKTLFHNQMAGVIVPEDLLPMYETVEEQLKTGNVVINENRLICKDGSIKWIWISCEYVKEENQEPYFYCMFHDITKQKQAQENLELSEKRYDIILSQTQDVIFEWNYETKEIYYSSTYEKKFGYVPPNKDFPKSVLDAGLVYPEDVPIFLELFRKIEEGIPEVIAEYRKLKADGSYLWCHISMTAILNAKGDLIKAIGMISDIDKQKREMLYAREQAMRDSLTGLYNRNATQQQIEDYIESHKGLSALMVIDVDNFKGINDTLGHIYGDAVLGDIAYNLKTLFQEEAIVGRVGGDEFVVFLTNIREEKEAIGRAEEVGRIFHRCFEATTIQYKITASIGIAFYPEDGAAYQELFERADLAMYHSKNNGKNQCAVFSEEIGKERNLLPKRKEKEEIIDCSKKNFRDNVLEYIFQIFYKNPDVNKAIPVLFDLVGKIFNESRVYIFEKVEEKNIMRNTFEWCNSGIPAMKEQYQNMRYFCEKTEDIAFDKRNLYSCSDVSQLRDQDLKEWFARRGVVSTRICKIQEGDSTNAIIGFEDCKKSRTMTNEERGVLSLIAQTISLFLMRTRKQEFINRQQEFSKGLLKQIKACIYGIEPNTYELIFINDSLKCHMQGIKLGQVCYRSIRGRNTPCEDCPMAEIREENQTVIKELYHPRMKGWSETSASFFQWINGEKICLLISFDITQYRADAAKIDFMMKNIPGGMLGFYQEEGFPLYFINSRMLECLGYDNEEEFKESNQGLLDNSVHPKDRELIKKRMEVQLARSDEFEIEYRMKKKDGTYRWFHDKGKAVLSEDGRKATFCLCMDITEQKELQSQLTLYRNASRGGAFLIRVDEGSTLLYGNDIYYQVHEYTKERMLAELGNSCKKYIYPEDLPILQNAVDRALKEENPEIECEVRVITGKGNIRWIEARGTLEYQDGEVLMNGFVIDNTEKHQLIEQLAYSEQRYRIALARTHINIWEYDIKSHVLTQTESSFNKHGFVGRLENVPEYLINIGYIHPDSQEDFRRLYRQLSEGAEMAQADIKTKTLDGKGWWWERIIYTTIFDKKGEPSYAIAVGEDITKQKEAEIGYQRELQMRNTLSDGIIASCRVNLTRNKVELLQRAEQPEIGKEELTYQELIKIEANLIVNPDDRERYFAAFSMENLIKVYEENRTSVSVEYRKKDNEGRIQWSGAVMRLIKDAINGDLYAYGSIRNIDAQKTVELALEQRAEKDMLTGVYNKDTAVKMFKEVFQQSIEKKAGIALLIFNVDNFNQLISKQGYLVAEYVLKELGSLLQTKFGGRQIVGKIYEDELAVLVKDSPTVSFIWQAANDIRETLHNPNIFIEARRLISVSVGIAFGGNKIKDLSELYRCARTALDQAKRKGKNQCVIYSQPQFSDNYLDSLQEKGIDQLEKDSEKMLLKCAFVLASPMNFDEAVSLVLGHIGKYYDADRVCMIVSDEKNSGSEHIYEWKKEGLLSIQGIQEGSQICEYLMPMTAKGEMIGYLGIDAPHKNKENQKVLNLVRSFLENEIVKRQMQRQQEYFLYHDTLTGLFNMNSYIKYNTTVSEEALSSLGVVSVDINGLKQLNTKYGHTYGDEVVKFTAKAIQEQMKGSKVYRLAGDEFLAISENLTKEAFIAHVKEMRVMIDQEYPSGVSIGYVWSDQDIRIDDMVTHADEHMRIAKQEYYKNCADAITKNNDPKMIKKLQEAIKSGCFQAYLQPKADIRTGEISGAEALVRYIHPQIGVIPPDRFISQLETMGTVYYIDLLIFEEVCRILKRWQKSGEDLIPISLNFSRSTLLHENLIERINEIYENYHVPKEMIEIEITESLGEIEKETLVRMGGKIKKCGFRLSLDDFGAKYSNLSILSSIHFDTLKLDKSLVNDLFSNPSTKIIVKNSLITCRELGIQSVAEGVETEEQLKVLQELECDYIQGYYLNKPLPIAEFEKNYKKSQENNCNSKYFC